MTTEIKPPIGIIPENQWKDRRIDSLCKALERYNEAGLSAPSEWLVELSRLIKERR